MKPTLATARLLFVLTAWTTLPLPAPLHGASPGFPFAENFQSPSLLNSTGTTARRASGGITLERARGRHGIASAMSDRRVWSSRNVNYISDVALQDMDGDGWLDVVVAGRDGIVVYFNVPATGTFFDRALPVTATFFEYLTFGDYDSDGDTDLVAGSWRNNLNVVLYENDGNGEFDEGAALNSSSSSLHVNGLDTADINGDGHLDLVLTRIGQNGGVDIYGNDGRGGFSLRKHFPSARPHWNVAVGDLNEDGRPDIVIAKKQGSSVFHFNLGGWNFDAAVAFGGVGNSVALGDLNNDGLLDIVLGSKSLENRRYLNMGGRFNRARTISGNHVTGDVALGDMDGDGDLDLVEGVIRGEYALVYANDGSGNFSKAAVNTSAVYTRTLALGDVDNDGDLDIATGNQERRLKIKVNPGGAVATLSDSLFDTGRGRMISGKVNGDEPVPHVVYLTATAVQQRHTEIEYYLSNDGGERWVRAYPGGNVWFPSEGNDLRWRAELKSRSPVRTATLTRIGIEDVLQVSIDGQAFRDGGLYTATSHTIGTEFTPVEIRLVNPGNRALTVTGVEAAGEGFVLQGEDGKALSGDIEIEEGDEHDDIRLVFNPEQRETIYNSTLTISGSEGGRVLPEIEVGLRGQGLAPEINLPEIGKPIEARVGTSDSRTVRVKNNGEESLSIRTPTITNPEFSLVNPAAFPVPVTADDSVEIGFWFEPEERGIVITTVTFASNAINSSETITLRGKGVAPVISVQQPGMDDSDSIERIQFGEVTATHISTLRHVIKNEGELPLIVTSVTVQNSWFQVIEPVFGGAFGPSREVPAGSTLALVVQFEPQGRATTNDALFIHSDAFNNNEVSPVPVDGMGIAAEMVIHVTEARVTMADTANQMIDSGDSYHFGDVVVNTTASARVFVSNEHGDAMLMFTPRLDGAGSFRWREPPGGPGMVEMKAGDITSTLVLSFAPTTHGMTSATLTLGDSNALEGDREIVLTGVGRGAEMEVRVGGRLLAAGTTHTVGDIRVDSSTEVRVEVHNRGNVPMNISRPRENDTGDMTGFVLDATGGLPSVVTDGHSVTFTFQFNPDKRGTAITGITFAGDAAVSGTQTIILKNRAVGPLIATAPDADTGVQFGRVRANSSTDREVVITNTGDAPMLVSSVTVVVNREGASESVLSLVEPKQFPQVVIASATLALKVRFMPERPDGVINGDLTIISDAVNVDNPGREPQKLDISGEAVASEITVWINGVLASKPDVMSYNFGDIRVDASSRAEVIIDNRGGSASLEVQSPKLNSPVLASNPHFDMTEKVDFPLVVAKGVSRSSLTLLFDPQERGPQTTTLTFVSDAFNGGSQVITLRGRGVGPDMVVEVDDVVREFGREFRFGERPVNTMTSVRVRIENRGNAALDIMERVKVETAAADFQFLDRDSTPTSKLRPTVDERHTPPYLVGESAPTIAAGSSSTFMLHFTPSVPSRKDNGRLVINSNDPDHPEWKLNLEGSGRGALMRVTLIANDAAHLHPVQTNVHDVGDVRVGRRLDRNGLYVRLQNLGNENLNVSLRMAAGSEGFSIDSQDKQHTLEEKRVRRPPIIFEPIRPGTHTGAVIIGSNDDFLREFRIQLRGRGLAPDIDVQAVDFGDVQVRGTSPAEVVVHNRGSAQLRIGNVVRGADTQFNHDISRFLPIFLEPDEVSTLSVSFSPAVQGVSSTTLTFISDSHGENSHAVTLKGRGVGEPRIQVAINDMVRRHEGTPHQFASQRVGTRASVEVRISNLGNVPLVITTPVRVETTAADFQFLGRDLTPTRKLRPTVDERHTPPYFVGESAPTIAAGSSSTFMLQFAPGVPSRKDDGRLVITSNDPDRPEWALKLKGSGRGALMRVTLITNDAAYLHPQQTNVHDVGDARLNLQLRGDLYVRLQNLGNEDLNVSLRMAAGSEGFSIDNRDRQHTLGEEQVRGPEIIFNPPRPGTHTGTMLIDSNDPALRQFRIRLRGTGLAPDIDVQAVDFGDVQVRGTSSAEVVVHNKGDARLRISNVVRGADTQFNHDISRFLPIFLEPDEVSTLSVSFSPTVQGVSSTTLTFISDAYGENSHAVTLNGRGVKPRLKVSFSGCAAGSSNFAGEINPNRTVNCRFGDVLVGESKTVTATLTNTGDGRLDINDIYINPRPSPLFALAGPSTRTINPGDSHSWGMKFTPTVGGTGNYTVWLYIRGNHDNLLPQFDFPARAVKPALIVEVNNRTKSTGGEHNFGERRVNTMESVMVTIRNRGSGTLKITEPIRVETTATDFQFLDRDSTPTRKLRPTVDERHTPPYLVGESARTIAPLGSSTFMVHFKPGVPSRKDNGRLVINSNDPHLPEWKLNLKGEGKGALMRVTLITNDAAYVHPTQTRVHDVGSVPVNRRLPGYLYVRLQNLGNENLNATLRMAEGSEGFRMNGRYENLTLEENQIRPSWMIFEPTRPGAHTGTVLIDSNDAALQEFRIQLKGRGLAPDIDVQAVDFGGVQVGGSSSAKVVVHNRGGVPLTIRNITRSANNQFSDDIARFTLPIVLQPKKATTLNVSFAPTMLGASSTTLTFISNSFDESSHAVTLEGRGIDPEIVVMVGGTTLTSGATIDLRTLPDVAVTTDIIVWNRGRGDLVVDTIGLVTSSSIVSSAGHYHLSRVPMTIPENSSHTWTLRFTPPDAATTHEESIRIASNDEASPFTLNVRGIGAGPDLVVNISGCREYHDHSSFIHCYIFRNYLDEEISPAVLTVRNEGDETFEGRVAVLGLNSDFFIIESTGTMTLHPGEFTTRAVTISLREVPRSYEGDQYGAALGYWRYSSLYFVSNDTNLRRYSGWGLVGRGFYEGIRRRAWAGGVQRPAMPTFTALEPADIIAPLFAGLGYGNGQSRLWLAFDEPAQILSGTGSSALADGAVLSGFEVLPNYTGGDGVEDIGVLRTGYRSGGVVMDLARGIGPADASLWVRYTPPPDGVSDIYDMAVPPNRISSPRLFMLPRSAVLDYDGDGFPDALEARLGGNPLVADDMTGLPEVALLRAGVVGSPAAVAYSGIRADGLEAHLGVVTTGASSLAAYYLSDTFGYSGGYAPGVGGYGCTGRFPADYALPLFGGGCAVVDFNSIRAGVEHRIGWLATNAAGYWAVADGTASRLPEQVILRVPEFNMKRRNVFVGHSAAADATVVVGAFHDGPASSQSLTVSLGNVAAADSPSSSRPDGFSVSVSGVTTDTTSYAITGVHSGEASKLWLAGDPLSSLTPDKYSLGKVTQTDVVRLADDNLPPLFGRASLYAGTTADINERHAVVVRGTESYIALLPVVHGSAQTASAFEVSPWDGASGGPVAADNRTLAVNEASPAADGALVRIAFTASNPPATVRNTVSLEVAAASVGAATATTVLTWPVIDSADALASIAGDDDNDGIPDVRDSYPLLNRLPISVAGGVSGYPDRSSAGTGSWHHIRPLLPLHNQFVGSYATRAGLSFHTGFVGDARILARLPVATSDGGTIAAPEGQNPLAATYQPGVPIQMNYADFAASLSRDEFGAMMQQSRQDIAVVYNFRLHGVEPSVAQDASLAGGRAGVVIPLPESLHDHTNILPLHYTNGAWSGFSSESDEPATVGFAPLQAGVCPDDSGITGSAYRTGNGVLNTRKRTGDACMVLYLTDGAAADRDGNINGVVDALIGLATPAPPR